MVIEIYDLVTAEHMQKDGKKLLYIKRAGQNNNELVFCFEAPPITEPMEEISASEPVDTKFMRPNPKKGARK